MVHSPGTGSWSLMDIKPMTLEEAFSIYDENPSDITTKPIENPEDVFDSGEAQAQPIEEPAKAFETE